MIEIKDCYDNKIYLLKNAIENIGKCVIQKHTNDSFTGKYFYDIGRNENNLIQIRYIIFEGRILKKGNTIVSIENKHNKNVIIFDYDDDKNKKLNDIYDRYCTDIYIEDDNIEFLFYPDKFFSDTKEIIKNELKSLFKTIKK